MIHFTPIFDRILIRRSDSATKKRMQQSGLILPDNAEYKASEGTLVACGDDCSDVVKDLLGKTVLFARYSGDDIRLNGEEFLIATDRDIFGGLEDAGESNGAIAA